MKRMRLSPCGCGEVHYRLQPRRWWMRALGGRRRYLCKQCGATLLLRRASMRRMRARSLLFVVLGLLVVAWASFYAVGYHEEWSYASWRRWAENQ